MAGLRTLLVACAFAAGILLADVADPAGATAAAAGAAAVACLAGAAFLHHREPEPEAGSLLPSLRAGPVALAAAGLVGAGFCALGLRHAALERALVPAYAGKTVEIAGRLAGDPRPNEYSTRFDLAVRVVEGRPAREKVAVSAYGRMPKIDLGDSVRISGKVRELDERDEYDASLSRKSIVAKVSVSASEIARLDQSQNWALVAADYFRSRIGASARAGAGDSRAGLVLGLVMGDQRRIPQTVIDDFRAAGLSHLTAVSGQNVAMVMVPLVLVMSSVRLGRRAQMIISLGVLALFAVVTRWEPSVLRAVLMASAALSAWLFGRRSNGVHLLALVFFVLLAVDPLLLWSIGFQLSFAATGGILLLGPSLSRRLAGPLSRPAQQSNSENAIPPAPVNRLAQAAAIGIAAQAAVLPLIAWHFGRMSLVSLPANLLALPLVAPITILGLAGGVVGMVSMQAATPLMWLAGLFAFLLEKVAALFGGSAHAQVSVGHWGGLELFALVLGIAAAGLWIRGNGRAARWPAVFAAVTVVLAGLVPAAGSSRPTGLRLTFFDVGQGDAALLESPSGARVLIDGGPDADQLAGRLKRKGIRRLDLVVASHGHADHVEGLGKVLRQFHVGIAVDPGIPTKVIREVFEEAGRTQGVLEPAEENEGIEIGDLSVEFLGPAKHRRESAIEGQTADPASGEGSALNDASVVAEVSFGRACALFPGDLEIEGQMELTDAHGDQIDCTVLKAPHHGSGRLLAKFVRSVDPEWVPISVGRNDYGHPAPKALAIFERAGARILRTDRMGDIVLNLGPDGRVTLGR